MEELYSLREVANILKKSDRSIYRYIYEDMIKAIKVGGSWMVKESDLKDFIERGAK